MQCPKSVFSDDPLDPLPDPPNPTTSKLTRSQTTQRPSAIPTPPCHLRIGLGPSRRRPPTPPPPIILRKPRRRPPTPRQASRRPLTLMFTMAGSLGRSATRSRRLASRLVPRLARLMRPRCRHASRRPRLRRQASCPHQASRHLLASSRPRHRRSRASCLRRVPGWCLSRPRLCSLGGGPTVPRPRGLAPPTRTLGHWLGLAPFLRLSGCPHPLRFGKRGASCLFRRRRRCLLCPLVVWASVASGQTATWTELHELCNDQQWRRACDHAQAADMTLQIVLRLVRPPSYLAT